MIKNAFNAIKKPIIICLLVIAVIFTGYHIFFANRIIPGVVIGGVRVGGMTYDKAIKALEDKQAKLPDRLTLLFEGRKFDISTKDIDLSYSPDAAITRAFEVGRTGNFYIDNKDKLAGMIKPLRIRAFYNFDDSALSLQLSGIKGEINIPASNAGFSLENNKLVRTPGVEGVMVDDQQIYEAVIESFNNMDFSEKQISAKRTNPDILVKELDAVEEEAQKIVFSPFKVIYEKREWKFAPEEILNLLIVKRSDKGIIEIGMDDDRVNVFMDDIASEVNELPRGHVDEVQDGKVVGFRIIQNGRELNRDEFRKKFKDALFSSAGSVDIPLEEVKSSDNPQKYGIFALLGEGKSRYTGSASGRIHNLTLAAERTSGVLVPPNGTYSLNRAIGEISYKTGYNTAYIIENGRTVLGEGGGVCQTSTTLFRAALNSGLPITMRYPHAYRVSYYELDSPVGYDAAIYQPSVDLQFKNDTVNYIMIQAEADKKNATLTFRIFGTPDGRSVEISKPVITNVAPAPPPLYQDDPTLPKGTTKQVDFAAGGANVVFTREVKRGDEVLYKDSFKSVYQPWRAVYLVGTKE